MLTLKWALPPFVRTEKAIADPTVGVVFDTPLCIFTPDLGLSAD